MTRPLAVLIMACVLTVTACAESLVPGGRALGIRMSTDGVVVAGLTEVETASGKISPARDAGLTAGDVIVRIGGTEISGADELSAAMRGLSGEKTTVTFERQGKTRQVNVTPAKCTDGSLRLGVLLRDGISGIGTLTFFDPATGVYGALGHSISDADSGSILPLGEGEICSAQIIGVTPGKAGEPGALSGKADEAEVLGDIGINCPQGIFGKAEFDVGAPLETGEMKSGSATILCTLDGEKVGEYSIEICRVLKDGGSCTAVIRATDPVLLSVSGGIVQGMSGSPIIQDGRLVGAVTHVFINDPTGGYAISIQDMLEAARQCIDTAA